jgi:hypothetical protein
MVARRIIYGVEPEEGNLVRGVLGVVAVVLVLS